MIGILFLLMLTDSQWLECKVKNPYSPGEGRKVTIKVMKPGAGFEGLEQRLRKFPRLLAGDLVLIMVENRTGIRFDMPFPIYLIGLETKEYVAKGVHPLFIKSLSQYFSWEEIAYASSEQVSVSPSYVVTRFAGSGYKWKDVTGGKILKVGIKFEVKGKSKRVSKSKSGRSRGKRGTYEIDEATKKRKR